MERERESGRLMHFLVQLYLYFHSQKVLPTIVVSGICCYRLHLSVYIHWHGYVSIPGRVDIYYLVSTRPLKSCEFS